MSTAQKLAEWKNIGYPEIKSYQGTAKSHTLQN